MKHVKSACILQTLVFSQKEEPGRSRDGILKQNRDEFEHYKRILERAERSYGTFLY